MYQQVPLTSLRSMAPPCQMTQVLPAPLGGLSLCSAMEAFGAQVIKYTDTSLRNFSDMQDDTTPCMLSQDGNCGDLQEAKAYYFFS